MYRVRNVFSVIFLFAIAGSLHAQISEGGMPPSYQSANKLKSALVEEIIPPPDLKKLVAEDRVNDSLGKPYRIAAMIPVDYCMDYSGKWDTLATGDVVWRLTLTSPGASGIQLIYDNFHLPVGGKLFLYSGDKKFLIGAFTEKNNHSSRIFATEIIPGESCTIEYVKSSMSTEKPSICISKVGYVYRGLSAVSPDLSNVKAGSASCEVNVRCSPEGDNWTDVKRSVARIVMSGYLCSGTLLNNTSQDFRSLLSTAFHCVQGIESQSLTWVFYFNYEYSTCSKTSRLSTGNTLTGADIRAKIPINGGSDAALLELKDPVPSTYNTFWTGWDRRDTVFAGGACLHHPAGDGTKVSTIRSFWQTSTWHGDSTTGAKNAHWGVFFAQTANGYGVTEGGSSGSGLFSPDGFFHGQLSGGSASCDLPYGDNLYGKLSYSWDKFGNTPNVQLKPWLDPTNTGATMLQGIDHNMQYGVFWTSSPPVISLDSIIHFKDQSKFNPTAWSWTFEGGNPSASNLPNPVVTYASPGLYNVSLTVTNDKGTNTLLRTDYVYVKPKPVWKQQNTKFPSPGRGIQGISIVDSLTLWAWAFDGFDPNNPILQFTRTMDGGDHWKADSIMLPSVQGYGMSNLYAVSKDTAYAAVFGPSGGGKILQTTNGGKEWVAQTSASFAAPNGFPNVVYFFNRSNGVCMGDPNNNYFEIYTTSNGGSTWTRVPSGNIPAKVTDETGTTNYYDAKGDTIWFGTSNGRVFRSVNKGQNWTVATTGLTGRLDVKFRNAKVGFAIQSSDSTHTFSLAKTTDGGASWVMVSVPSNLVEGGFTSIPQSNLSWINVNASPGGSSFSSDDGTSFSVMDSDNPYTSVSFFNPFIGWAGSYNLDSITGGMYKWDRKNRLLTDVSVLASPAMDKSLSFSIQPNPATDYIIISSNKDIVGDVKVSVVNVKGMLMDYFTFRNNQGSFNQTFGLSNLSKGLYLIVIQGGSTVETHKIVVQ